MKEKRKKNQKTKKTKNKDKKEKGVTDTIVKGRELNDFVVRLS